MMIVINNLQKIQKIIYKNKIIIISIIEQFREE